MSPVTLVLVLCSLSTAVSTNDRVNICDMADEIGIPVSYLPCKPSNKTANETGALKPRTKPKPREALEDSDMFTNRRIAYSAEPRLTKYYLENTLEFYDTKIMFAYRFLIRNESCNITEFNQIMPDFWDHYFEGTADSEDAEQFAYRYWNVSVNFKPHATNATVLGHCNEHHRSIENCTVQRTAQLIREKQLCFSGGLLECSGDTQTCVCLVSHGTETIRVNHATGMPDPERGTACFVKPGEKCLVKHYGAADLKLPCALNTFCSEYSGTCVRQIVGY